MPTIIDIVDYIIALKQENAQQKQQIQMYQQALKEKEDENSEIVKDVVELEDK